MLKYFIKTFWPHGGSTYYTNCYYTEQNRVNKTSSCQKDLNMKLLDYKPYEDPYILF